MHLQLDEAELERLQRLAARKGLTTEQLVKQTLVAASREAEEGDADRKLAAIRAAARHEYPTADIERMLEEIESGYL